jgi:hypothetical protein
MVGISCFNEELLLLPKNPTEAKLQATSTRGESTEPTKGVMKHTYKVVLYNYCLMQYCCILFYQLVRSVQLPVNLAFQGILIHAMGSFIYGKNDCNEWSMITFILVKRSLSFPDSWNKSLCIKRMLLDVICYFRDPKMLTAITGISMKARKTQAENSKYQLRKWLL